MSGEASSAAAAPSSRLVRLRSALEAAVPGQITGFASDAGELTWRCIRGAARRGAGLARRDGLFEMCMDVCGVDYLEHGRAEWKTQRATLSGFSRGVARGMRSGAEAEPGRRFAVVYHLLSVSLNQRLRLRVFCEDDGLPAVDSVAGIWASADWFVLERSTCSASYSKAIPTCGVCLPITGSSVIRFARIFPCRGT